MSDRRHQQRQRQQRQVLPDADEGAERFGYSILGLMRIYWPSLAVFFLVQHYAPPGFGWFGVVLGLALFAGATAAVLASPSHVQPGTYARNVIKQYTQQGVKLHE